MQLSNELIAFEKKYNKMKQCVKMLKQDNTLLLDKNQDLEVRINELIRENEQLKVFQKSFNQTKSIIESLGENEQV